MILPTSDIQAINFIEVRVTFNQYQLVLHCNGGNLDIVLR